MVKLSNILYLTDFSEPSEAALPVASDIARSYNAKLYALHVLLPPVFTDTQPELATSALDAWEQHARDEMQRVEAELVGLRAETLLERDAELWPAFERAVKDRAIDLAVLGTHGRTGAQRLLLGSVAEEIFRRSPVPVLTVGPHLRSGAHHDARFRRILYPTDFTPESLAAAPYALSFAEENQARLVLLHVIRELNRQAEAVTGEGSAAEAMHRLQDLIPEECELWCRPHTVVEYGHPGEQILETAVQHGADLIVLGVRDAQGHIGTVTHLRRSTAHSVLALAQCPVLTVRQSAEVIH